MKTRTANVTRLNWRPKPEDWGGIGRSYCSVFETAICAAMASNARRTLAAIDSMDLDFRLVNLIEAADRRVERANEALAKKRPLAGFEGSGAESLSRRSAGLSYEQAERDRIVSTHRAAEKTFRVAKARFASLTKGEKVAEFEKEHRLGDLESWALKGRNWQLEITDLVQRYHERTMEVKSLEYRAGVVKAARAFIAAVESPIDPQLRIQALGDIKRAVEMVGEEFDTAVSLVHLISRSGYGATEFPSEAEIPFVAGTPWGQFIVNLQSFARRNDMPSVIGKKSLKDRRYADFAEFAWSINETLPLHIKFTRAKSTFARKASEVASSARDFAEETARLRANGSETVLPVRPRKN